MEARTPAREFVYTWQWRLKSSPEALWPFVAETNRFNRDVGLPAVERLAAGDPADPGASERAKGPPVPRQRLRFVRMGVPVEWIEEPFEWSYGRRFGVLRRYTRGPFAEVRTRIDLEPTDDGGTLATYRLAARPRNLLGYLAIPVNLGRRSGRSFETAFRGYDRAIQEGRAALDLFPVQAPMLAPGAIARLDTATASLVSAGAPHTLVENLRGVVEKGDEIAVRRLRPYELADVWAGGRASVAARRGVLELCLDATRVGLLDLSWDLLCPVCRVVKDQSASLRGLASSVHCEVCNLDYSAELDRSVELSFRPNPAIRLVDSGEYCVAGPGVTPHVVLQQLLGPGESRLVDLVLARGLHRFRVVGGQAGPQVDVVDDAAAPALGRGTEGFGQSRQQVDGVNDDFALPPSADAPTAPAASAIRVDPEGRISNDVRQLATNARLALTNAGEHELLLVLERTAWGDRAVTAADATSLQRFRDLFASEALAPGQQISVGRLAVLFTDLRASTRLYRDIGDGPAFARVLRHFDVVRDAIAEEGGGIVKTMGDAVLAVFPRPAPALRAVLAAQRALASGAGQAGSTPHAPLVLKAGLHFGPCIAVTLNDRLDYFGSTVNVAARLVGLSGGEDLVVSNEVMADAEVRDILAARAAELEVRSGEVPIRGFGEQRFAVWRIAPPSVEPTAYPWHEQRAPS